MMRHTAPRRLALRGTLALTALTLTACDIPTGLPRIETRFVVPGETTTLSVDELLPAGVSTAGSNFLLTVDAQAIPTTSLAQLCGATCAPFHGLLVPKPAFTGVIPFTLPLPAQVAGVTVTSGMVNVSITHNFGFDPLQPSGRTEDGVITLTIRAGGSVIGTGSIAGAFPSGSTRTAVVALTPGDVTDDLDVTLEIVSPAGGSAPSDWIVVNNNAVLYGSAAPGQVLISEARVAVQNLVVSGEGVSLDLSDIDLDDRVRGGAIVLTTSNPFSVGGSLRLVLAGGGVTVQKDVQLAPGETTQRVEFTGPELQSLLGSDVLLTVTGEVGSAQPVSVRPGQVITFDTLLEFVFELGSQD